MKYILILILIVHALIHALGFLKEWKVIRVEKLQEVSISFLPGRTVGTIWFFAFAVLLISAVAYYFGKSWWWLPAAFGAVVSQVLIIFYWKDAKWGTIVNIIILAVVIVSYARARFDTAVKLEVEEMYTMSAPNTKPDIISESMLKDLPSPVQRWLSSSGIVGKPRVRAIRLKQKGLMRSAPGRDKWFSIQAEQYFDVDPPGFIWKANMKMMPLVAIDARDKYVNGKGEMKVTAFSVIPVANSNGTAVDQSALQRYLAEICWFPSAALSTYIQWQAIDETSAKATLTYKGVSGTGVFRFDDRGDITSFSADRYMSTGKTASLEKWVVKNLEYGEFAGIRIPVKSEATWKLKDGDFTWLKLEIIGIDYNNNRMY